MTTLTVTLPSNVATPPTKSKMYIKTEDGKDVFTVPYAPKNVTFDGRIYDYGTVERAGRRALQLRKGPQTPGMSFDLFLGGKQYTNFRGYQDQTSRIQQLQRIFSGSKRVLIVGIKWLSNGYWRATSMEIQTEELNPDQSVKTCTVSCEFVQAEDYVKAKGPTSGGVKAKPKKTSPKKKSAGGSKKSSSKKKSKSVRYYTVKKGDNLTKIASRFYSNASMWRKIADANKIKNPKKLKVGKKLKLP